MRSICFLFLALATACGGSAPPAKSSEASTEASESKPAAASDAADAPASSTEKPAEAGGDASIPTKCAKSGSPCTPAVSFVKKLCNGNFPSVALYLFGNGLPFSKGYLTRRTQAWNAAGGASDNSWLEFDEEVLVLLQRAADTGGMQVSGAGGGFEALRWNGSCVTLAKEELTLDKPPSPKTAHIDFRFLDDNVQEALRADEAINSAFRDRRKECKGATSGEVSMKCVKADTALSDAIVSYARKGGAIPVPKKLP